MLTTPLPVHLYLCVFSSSLGLSHQLCYLLFLHKCTGEGRIFGEALGWGDEELQDAQLKGSGVETGEELNA